jgi:hypothetical protein
MNDTDLTKYENKITGLFKEKTPAKYIKHRPGAGGMSFPYIEVGYVIGKLNSTFTPLGWEWKVVDKGIGKKQVWVQGDLVIKFPNGWTVTRSGFGGSQIKCYKGTDDPVDISNDLKGASSAALKKAASLLGIAADVYYKEQDQFDDLPDDIPAPTAKDMAEQKRKSTLSHYFGVAADRGFNAEEAKRVAKARFKMASTADLSVFELDQLIRSLEEKYAIVEGNEKPRLKTAPAAAIVITGDVVESTKFVAIQKEDLVTVAADVEQEEVDVDEVADKIAAQVDPAVTRDPAECGNPDCKRGDNGTRAKSTAHHGFCSPECQDAYYPNPNKKTPWVKPTQPTLDVQTDNTTISE